MVHGIHNFYSSVAKNQLLRDFSFRLRLVTTDALTFTEDEIVYANAKTLPARNITNHQISFMGLPLNFAGSATYPSSDSYEIELLMDATGALREKLEKASRTVFNDKSSTGDYRLAGTDQTIVLSTIDSKLETMVNYTLVGAQIRNISPIQFDYWGGNGNLVKCTITVAYQYYTTSSGSSDKVVSK